VQSTRAVMSASPSRTVCRGTPAAPTLTTLFVVGACRNGLAKKLRRVHRYHPMTLRSMTYQPHHKLTIHIKMSS
jgi:hypothetical protein